MTSEKTTVLVVEDDMVDREAVHRQLSGDRYELIDAATADEARRRFAEAPPDCVLLDYSLPDAKGLEMIPEFGELGVPVVMLTGHGNEVVAVEAMKRGAEDYLVKPVADKHALERAVRNALERATLRRKLDEKQEELESFAYVAAHDLKAPLRTIFQFSELAERDLEEMDQQKLRKHLGFICNGARSAYLLVNSLLEYTRTARSDAAFEEVDVAAVVGEVIDGLEAPIRETGARITVGSLPPVVGDAIGVKQLFQNLIANAVKFSRGEPVISVGATEIDGELRFSVSDNGPGIDPKYHQKIFAPLGRLHGQDVEGCGIGLAVCRKVVAQHGGRIWVDSLPCEGATFWFTLSDGDGESRKQ